MLGTVMIFARHLWLRLPTVACPALLSLLLACNGVLIVSEETCQTSGQCGVERVCRAATCVASDAACSESAPEGHCPPGRSCSAGVCLRDDGALSGWCACRESEKCDRGVCVDAVSACSASVVDGDCGPRRVCVAGSCTLLSSGSNSCSPQRPEGLCPSGSACLGGFCIPIADLPCGPAGGLCVAGQRCAGGRCEVAPCSETALYGACDGADVCVAGECVAPETLLTCADLACASLNRAGCDDSAAVAVCLDCLAGYHANGPLCVANTCADLNCPAERRLCDASGPAAVCGACMSTYTIDTSSTATPPPCRWKTCEELDCAGLRRLCPDPGDAGEGCGECLDQYFPGPQEACVPPTCDALGCAARHRQCDGQAGEPRSCGECLPDYRESVDGNRCVQCESSAQCSALQSYCAADGTCQSECSSTPTSDTCPGGQQCSRFGRCFPTSPDQEYCGVGQAEGERQTPTVVLLVDRSASMYLPYVVTPSTIFRWTAMGTALFGQAGAGGALVDGVVRQLQDEVIFGMSIYDYDLGSCPEVVTEAPKIGNMSALKTDFDSVRPRGETPTGYAIAAVAAQLGSPSPDERAYILLATDGLPNGCNSNSTAGKKRVVDNTETAFQSQGITLFPLFVGEADAAVIAHMQEVADVGVGFPRGSGKGKFFEAKNPAELSQTLSEILRSVLTCSIRLTTLKQRPLRGEVFIDGDLVPAAEWALTSDTTVELLGSSCAKVKDGKPHSVSARFDLCGGGG